MNRKKRREMEKNMRRPEMKKYVKEIMESNPEVVDMVKDYLVKTFEGGEENEKENEKEV